MIDSLTSSEPELQPSRSTTTSEVVSTNWRARLPVLAGQRVRLRELRGSDAPSLFAMVTTDEVARFISPPPTSVEGFEAFIAWMLHQRLNGTNICFAVTLQGKDTAIGIFQVRRLDTTFETAEWGFALGSKFWGPACSRKARSWR